MQFFTFFKTFLRVHNIQSGNCMKSVLKAGQEVIRLQRKIQYNSALLSILYGKKITGRCDPTNRNTFRRKNVNNGISRLVSTSRESNTNLWPFAHYTFQWTMHFYKMLTYSIHRERKRQIFRIIFKKRERSTFLFATCEEVSADVQVCSICTTVCSSDHSMAIFQITFTERQTDTQ